MVFYSSGSSRAKSLHQVYPLNFPNKKILGGSNFTYLKDRCRCTEKEKNIPLIIEVDRKFFISPVYN